MKFTHLGASVAAAYAEFDYQDRTLEYKFRPPKRDRRHLLVIFSGGFVGGIDFSGKSTEILECAILWVRDPHNSYYIQKGSDRWYSDATQALIEEYMRSLGISKENVTMLGASKGGTAAIYHGLTGGYSNIVVSAPRIHPARGNKQERPRIVSELVGSTSHDDEEKFDKLLPSLIQQSPKNKNIYLFTSLNDVQYTTDIEPNLQLFSDYDNFNLICTDSPAVNQHEDITLYNIQSIISLVGLLSDNFSPKLDKTANGIRSTGNSPASPENTFFDGEIVNDVDLLEVRSEGLWLAGRSFIRGIDASDYSSVRRFLRLKRAKKVHKAYLGGLKDRRNNRDYFDHEAISYAAGGYAPQGNKPISLDDLAPGIYEASMQVITGNKTAISNKFNVRPGYSFKAVKDYIVCIETENELVQITKRPIHLKTIVEGHFSVNEYWLKSGILHLSGRFSLNNIDISKWNDVDYRLLFIDEKNRHVSAEVSLAKYSNDLNQIPWRDNSKANYSTPRHRGIPVPSLKTGSYRLAVVGSFKNFLQTADTNMTLSVGNAPDDIHLVKH